MKKLLKSRAFQAAALSIACIGILAVCFLAGRDREAPFQPEEPSVESQAQEWTKPQPTARPAAAGNHTAPTPAKIPEDTLESYPQVVEESEGETVIDFTPDAPELKEDPPAPDGNPGNGAVYDPVFGWVVPGKVVQSSMDSPGDPDKMVGNMGN